MNVFVVQLTGCAAAPVLMCQQCKRRKAGWKIDIHGTYCASCGGGKFEAFCPMCDGRMIANPGSASTTMIAYCSACRWANIVQPPAGPPQNVNTSPLPMFQFREARRRHG